MAVVDQVLVREEGRIEMSTAGGTKLYGGREQAFIGLLSRSADFVGGCCIFRKGSRASWGRGRPGSFVLSVPTQVVVQSLQSMAWFS